MASTTLRKLLKGSHVSFHRHMTPQQMVNAWARVPAAVKALVPPVDAAMTALGVILAAERALVRTYETAVKARKTVQVVVIKASATLTGNPIAAQYAAEDSGKAAQESARAATNSALVSVKNSIMDAPITVPDDFTA